MSKKNVNKDIGFFEKYLTLWVGLCIVVGVAVGQLIPAFPTTISKVVGKEAMKL